MKPAPDVLDFCAPVKEKSIRLALVADWHYGSPQCNVNGIERFVNYIKETNCYWIGLGDLMENALLHSLGDVYNQKIPPGSQLMDVVQILSPITDKCLAMVSGNHSYRTEKQAGLDPDQVLAALLGIEDRYFGISVLGRIRIGRHTNWRIVAHHTTGGGRTKGGKINALGRMAEIWPMCDLYIGAHTHFDQYFSDRIIYLELSHSVTPRYLTRHFTGAGSTLDYENSYAHRKMMPPASMGQVVLTLGERIHRTKDPKRRPESWEFPLSREVFRL